MAAVPAGARGLARTAVLRWAMERGHSVVSSGDVATALDELMPFARVQRRIAETAAVVSGAEQAMLEEPAVEDARAVCRTCGYAARSETPVRCPVCGADAEAFDRLDSDALRAVAAGEGDAAQVAFDGAKLGWTVEARRLLQQLPAGYLRRRVKAIVEKHARTRRLPAITADVAEPFVHPSSTRSTTTPVRTAPRSAWSGTPARQSTSAAGSRGPTRPTTASSASPRGSCATSPPSRSSDWRSRSAHHRSASSTSRRGSPRRVRACSARQRPTAAAPAPWGRSPRRRWRGAPCTTVRDDAAAVRQPGRGLNEITAPVIDDLGRRITAAAPEA